MDVAVNLNLLTWAALALVPSGDAYPNAKILIHADATAKLDPKAVVILDARDEKSYLAGHVPGAIRVPAAEWGKAVPDTPEAWAKRLAQLGIKSDTPVVVYAGADVRDAARAWWLLKYAGADDVRLLDGGFPAWQKAGGASETTENAARPIEPGKPVVRPERLAEKKDVLSILKDKSSQVLDARSEAEFCGTAGTAKRTGHIPGAIAIEWTELLTTDKTFKPPEELKKLFTDRKVDLDKPAVTYCQSGGRAAVLAFGLELMGAKNVRNYYKSWSEWGNAEDTPVEVPKK
jgi:thiosulfate/3-mercaptopyruvate sulfurtransferase